MIFVDAGAFIARHRTDDQNHAAGLHGWNEIERRKLFCVTTSFVIAEAGKFLCQRAGNGVAAQCLRAWLGSERLIILRSDREIELEAVNLLERYKDQRIGFADCVSFVFMRKRGIDRVFGFDRHFRIAGFTLWPGERHP